MSKLMTAYGVKDYVGEKTIVCRTLHEALAEGQRQGHPRPKVEAIKMSAEEFGKLPEWDG